MQKRTAATLTEKISLVLLPPHPCFHTHFFDLFQCCQLFSLHTHTVPIFESLSLAIFIPSCKTMVKNSMSLPDELLICGKIKGDLPNLFQKWFIKHLACFKNAFLSVYRLLLYIFAAWVSNMGLLALGTPLTWSETKQYADHVRKHGILQFLHIYNKLKDRENDCLKWGDEVNW